MTTQPDMLDLILAQVNQVLTTSKRPHRDSIDPSLHLQQDLGLDSLELAELTVRLEAETGVDVFKDGVVRTVGEVIYRLRRCS